MCAHPIPAMLSEKAPTPLARHFSDRPLSDCARGGCSNLRIGEIDLCHHNRRLFGLNVRLVQGVSRVERSSLPFRRFKQSTAAPRNED